MPMKPWVNKNRSEHTQCDELSHREYLVCEFNPCYLSGDKREPSICPWAVANGEGNKDCGYG